MSKVIYCYDREEIKDIVKEAIAEYEVENKRREYEDTIIKNYRERMKLECVEEEFRIGGYKRAKELAKHLGVRIPYWMEDREER